MSRFRVCRLCGGSRCFYRKEKAASLIIVMTRSFDNSLSALKNATVDVMPGNGYPEPGQASILLRFSNGALLRAEFWRMVKEGRAGISSFDHLQKYGLPAPVDALSVLKECLHDKSVVGARLQPETGDLLFEFTGQAILQVFNFTGYEIWEMRFADGAVEYSNYVK